MLQSHKVAIALPQIQPEFLELHAFGGLESSDTGTLMLPPPYVSSLGEHIIPQTSSQKLLLPKAFSDSPKQRSSFTALSMCDCTDFHKIVCHV